MPYYGHTVHTQPTPDAALEGHIFGRTHVRETRVHEVATSENPVTWNAIGIPLADEHISHTHYGGTPVSSVSMQPRAQVFVSPKIHSLNVPPRVSDVGDNGRILCPHDGCESWFGSHNPHKLAKHITKKHGGA